MSIFHPATLICPNCSTANTVERNASVNADRRPDLRDAVLDGSFQATECTKCGTALRLPPHLTYMDLQRTQGILAHVPDHLDDWPQTEAAACLEALVRLAVPRPDVRFAFRRDGKVVREYVRLDGTAGEADLRRARPR